MEYIINFIMVRVQRMRKASGKHVKYKRNQSKRLSGDRPKVNKTSQRAQHLQTNGEKKIAVECFRCEWIFMAVVLTIITVIIVLAVAIRCHHPYTHTLSRCKE